MAELRKRKNVSQSKGSDSAQQASSGSSKKDYLKSGGGGLLQPGGFVHKLACYCFEKEDSSALAFFRIGWSFVMMFEFVRFIQNDYGKMVGEYFLNPYNFQFKYWAFEWVPLVSFPTFQTFLWVALTAAFFMFIGFLWRLSATVVALSMAYLFLTEASNHLNHIYLSVLVSFILPFYPANAALSVDALLFKSVRSDSLPQIWSISLKSFMFIVYTFAGVVKMNEDWLRGEPLRHWIGDSKMARNSSYAIVRAFMRSEPAVWFFSYGGIVFDATVGLLLTVNKYTFYLGILLSLFFHLTNKLVFNIGIFPWLMIASTCVFFKADWLRRLFYALASLLASLSSIKVDEYKPVVPNPEWTTTRVRTLTRKEIFMFATLLLFLAFNVLFPLRHYTWPGNVAWNQYGHRFSWRMKLRTLKCSANVFGFQPETNQSFTVTAADGYLTPDQLGMLKWPEQCVQASHFFAELYTTPAGSRPEIYFYNLCNLNYRKSKLLFNPHVDLAAEPKWDWPYHWVNDYMPLSAEERSQYPWNWEWNFNWLHGKNIDNRLSLQREYNNRVADARKQRLLDEEDFLQHIAKKHLGGDVDAARLKSSISQPDIVASFGKGVPTPTSWNTDLIDPERAALYQPWRGQGLELLEEQQEKARHARAVEAKRQLQRSQKRERASESATQRADEPAH